MAEKQLKGFYVRFLGGFSLYFAGQEILFEVNPLGKTMQLMYFLLKSGSKGCEKKELLQLVRPGEKDKKKRMNNFRQQLFQMRKLIEEANFPKGNYIVYQEDRYYFTLDYPLHVDTEKLDNLIDQMKNWTGTRAGTIKTGAKSKDSLESKNCLETKNSLESSNNLETINSLESNISLETNNSLKTKNCLENENGQKPWQQYEEYCEAYMGEFLPILGGEEWVTLESARYQKWYFTCLNRLSVWLKEQKRFERLLRLATVASQFHPYDEWQVVQIECLMALDRRREAEKVYEEASELFYKDLGVNSLERVMASYPQQPCSCSVVRALEKMKEGLEEEEEERQGAYLCSYPSFVDIYRIRARMDENNKEHSFLLLCTLSAEKGEWRESEGKEQMELFQKTLVEGTRSGDVYTKYSKNQYLVLLSDAGKGMEKQIISRLENNWKKAGGRAMVKFSIDKVEGAKGLGGS